MSMPAVSDSLRYTLDTLTLDPEARADRRYLVTVLQRLGYSAEEIRIALGHDALPAEPDEGRDIEVEYLASSDVQEFEPVFKEHPRGFTVADTLHEEADNEVDFVEVEPSQLMQFEEPKRLRLRVVHAETAEDAEEMMRQAGLDVVRAVPVVVDVNPPTAEERQHWAERPGEPRPASVQESAGGPAPPWPEPAWQQPAARTAAAPWPDEGDWEDAPPAWDAPDEGAWVKDGPIPGREDPAGPAIGRIPARGAGGAIGPYTYEGYTLYARDVSLPGGSERRIYFFAKGSQAGASPSPMPEGYEVRVNDKTGLPFLSRSRGGEA
jgi:hypothetical protein